MNATTFHFSLLVGLLTLTLGHPRHGLNEKNLTGEKRIRGGTDVDISQAKYYVLVKCGRVTCGGTLISRNKVLTAGHCVDSCQAREFQITVGLNSMAEYNQAKKYGATAINMHPKYNKSNPFPFDAAVATLSGNVELNQNVGTIPYASTVPRVGNVLTIVGYGLLNINGQLAQKLQRTQGKIVENNETLIITDATGPSALNGDSGGPAIYADQLAGITSGMQFDRLGQIIKNLFVAVGHPEIQNFIRQYAP